MKSVTALALFCLTAASFGAEEYLGLYLQGTKIGYAAYTTGPATLDGKPVTKSTSKTLMNMGVLGTPMKIQIDSTTYTSKAGKPVRMIFSMESAGRGQKVDATFGEKQAKLKVDNSGTVTTRTLDIPAGATIVDDPMTLVVDGKAAIGQKKVFHILDPMTVSFIKNEVRIVGPAKTSVKGRSFDATKIEIIDPRATMSVFVSSKGDLIRVEGPMGIEMLPEPKAVAMGIPGGYAPTVDLAFATSVKPDKKIEDPAKLTGLKLKITGKDLAHLPSDEHQTTSKEGDAWIVDVHPPQLDAAEAVSIDEAAKQKPEWVKPGLHMPSDAANFKALAGKIVTDRSDVVKAATAIQMYVNQNMKPNAGIGVLRDATEIIETKEGVCRDYAILTGTLLRAAGIPTRLASGLVNWDGTFYYHAWNEVWDGNRWVGIDSTTRDRQLSASHVKLGHGTVEQAFTFSLLDNVKVEVLDTRRN